MFAKTSQLVSHYFVTYFVLVAVTQLAWYKEDHEFFVGFSDGMLSRCTRDETDSVTVIEAHEVLNYDVTLFTQTE